jgi:hypothetical protein
MRRRSPEARQCSPTLARVQMVPFRGQFTQSPLIGPIWLASHTNTYIFVPWPQWPCQNVAPLSGLAAVAPEGAAHSFHRSIMATTATDAAPSRKRGSQAVTAATVMGIPETTPEKKRCTPIPVLHLPPSTAAATAAAEAPSVLAHGLVVQVEPVQVAVPLPLPPARALYPATAKYGAKWAYTKSGGTLKYFDPDHAETLEAAFQQWIDTVYLTDAVDPSIKYEVDLKKMMCHTIPSDQSSSSVARHCTSKQWMTLRMPIAMPPSENELEPLQLLSRAKNVRLHYSTHMVWLTGPNDTGEPEGPVKQVERMVRAVLQKRQPQVEWNFEVPPSRDSRSKYSAHTDVIFVPVASKEFLAVSSRMQETLPIAQVITVQRIQNLALWRKYLHEQEYLRLRGSSIADVSLFHGTQRVNPICIAHSEVGFDFRLSSDRNFWGRAMYFASNANYVDAYAHMIQPKNGVIDYGVNGPVPPGCTAEPPPSPPADAPRDPFNPAPVMQTKQLIIASVLVGDPYYGAPEGYVDSFRSLRRPPRKGSPALLGTRTEQVPPPAATAPSARSVFDEYDSVCGEVCGSKNYAVYAFHRAYPRYIVTYKAPFNVPPATVRAPIMVPSQTLGPPNPAPVRAPGTTAPAPAPAPSAP